MKVSIGIPFFNCEDFLGHAIKSVLAQTYTDWELILIDDGSTDESLNIALSFKDERIRVISDGKNKKLANRLNQIISESKGEYIARMDADDMLDPFRLEKQMKILMTNPNFDLVSTGVASISNDNLVRGIRVYQNVNLSSYDMISGNIGIVHASVLARKSWYLRNSYRENIIAEDYDLWNRAYFKNDLKCYKIPKPLYYYREDGNVTYYKLMRAYKNQIEIIKSYKNSLSNMDYLKININMYLKVFIIYFLNLFGVIDILLNKRANIELNENEKKQIENNINFILEKF